MRVIVRKLSLLQLFSLQNLFANCLQTGAKLQTSPDIAGQAFWLGPLGRLHICNTFKLSYLQLNKKKFVYDRSFGRNFL